MAAMAFRIMRLQTVKGCRDEINKIFTVNQLSRSTTTHVVRFLSRRIVKDDSWKAVKEKYLNMDMDEKRLEYMCKGNYLDIRKIRPWPAYFEKMKLTPTEQPRKYAVNFPINNRVAMGYANLIGMELDAIVNSAALDMQGGGGQGDKIIHEAAGPELKVECANFHGCDIGEAKITGGYRLPAKYIIHTVGPSSENSAQLNACYKSCFEVIRRNKLKTIAFPCISTLKGYPAIPAAHVALNAVRKFLQKHPDKPKLICFVIFREQDLEAYHELMQVYFPLR